MAWHFDAGFLFGAAECLGFLNDLALPKIPAEAELSGAPGSSLTLSSVYNDRRSALKIF
jgi:hypothetical protein